jgi:hypothetical protein
VAVGAEGCGSGGLGVAVFDLTRVGTVWPTGDPSELAQATFLFPRKNMEMRITTRIKVFNQGFCMALPDDYKIPRFVCKWRNPYVWFIITGRYGLNAAKKQGFLIKDRLWSSCPGQSAPI